MPTGYTAGVEDGTITNPRDFILRCARAMGACIMQRDDPMNEPPKKIEEHDSYIAKALAEQQRKLHELLVMTRDDKHAAFEEEGRRLLVDHQRQVAENEATLDRYKAMVKYIEEWTPPTTDHEGLKTFMLSQLNESIKWDCYPPRAPTLPSSPGAYHADRVACCNRLIRRYQEQLTEKEERNAGRNKWIDQLYASVEKWK